MHEGGRWEAHPWVAEGDGRVRLGVGRPPSRETGVDHVLQTIPKRQQEEAVVLVAEAAEAVLTLITDGLSAAQERFNRSGLARG